jgi:fumarate reductase flavoprotein subunit
VSALAMRRLHTDILILGAGGAGLFAALHARQVDPSLAITVAVKGLLGKCGCTRMVQGGYNVALGAGDSVQRHFMDTIEGGAWLSDQDLAWTLVTGAVERVRELENELGCFFDRNPDGTIHQKAFAGQSFDRTVHKGDLTGIEIMNRLAEAVWASDIERLEEHRLHALIKSVDGSAMAGALLIDMRSGEYVLVNARAVLLATGGGPTMYRFHTPSGDKSCDGLALALAAGLPLRDMEMVQFHPTGLLAGPDTRMTGTVLEEGLRGAGGHLLDGAGGRFMVEVDARAERATRDIVARAIYGVMRAGRTTPQGGVYLSMAHLGPENVRRAFRGMVERCADCGFDLAAGKVEVVPTAHYLMGGVEFAPDCTTELPGFFVAGEDSGGVHGANRLGGNGVANSTVFGGIAGATMARWVLRERSLHELDAAAVAAAIARAETPFAARGGHADLEAIREGLYATMWDDAGIVRNAQGLARAESALAALAAEHRAYALPTAGRDRAFNLAWHDWLNLGSLLAVSRVIVCAAQARTNSRGAHYRDDYPDPGDLAASAYSRVRQREAELSSDLLPVRFTRVRPGESLLPG